MKKIQKNSTGFFWIRPNFWKTIANAEGLWEIMGYFHLNHFHLLFLSLISIDRLYDYRINRVLRNVSQHENLVKMGPKLDGEKRNKLGRAEEKWGSFVGLYRKLGTKPSNSQSGTNQSRAGTKRINWQLGTWKVFAMAATAKEMAITSRL